MLDEDCGGRLLVDALTEAGEIVRLVRDEFGPGARDSDWLPIAGQRGWAVITRDKRQRFAQVEGRLIRESHVKYFVIRARNLTGQGMADAVMKARHRIKQLAASRRGYLMAKIDRRGRVTVVEEADRA